MGALKAPFVPILLPFKISLVFFEEKRNSRKVHRNGKTLAMVIFYIAASLVNSYRKGRFRYQQVNLAIKTIQYHW